MNGEIISNSLESLAVLQLMFIQKSGFFFSQFKALEKICEFCNLHIFINDMKIRPGTYFKNKLQV